MLFLKHVVNQTSLPRAGRSQSSDLIIALPCLSTYLLIVGWDVVLERHLGDTGHLNRAHYLGKGKPLLVRRCLLDPTKLGIQRSDDDVLKVRHVREYTHEVAVYIIWYFPYKV